MSELSLTLGAAASAVTAVAYAIVGKSLLGRHVAAPDRLAMHAFSAWWLGLAATTVFGLAHHALWSFGVENAALIATIAHLNVLALVGALWGLFYYLAYLFVGKRRLLWPSVALYAGILALFVYLVVGLGPARLVADTWSVRLAYANTIPPPLMVAALALLLVPILLAAIAYATLLFRLEDRAQRFRVGVVSIAILVWFGTLLGASLAGVSNASWYGLASRGLSLAAALAIYFAYRPPTWVARGIAHPPSEGH